MENDIYTSNYIPTHVHVKAHTNAHNFNCHNVNYIYNSMYILLYIFILYIAGVLCDKKVLIKLKDKVYKTVIKPTMTYGTECWAVRKKDENRLHVAEMRMLRWIRGNTRKDHVRNKTMQEDAKVCHISTFLRQKPLHWYGHVKRREEDNLSRKMMDVVVLGKRRRGLPRLRWTDNNREDMTKYELTADMTENGQYWKMMVKTGPQRSGDGL